MSSTVDCFHDRLFAITDKHLVVWGLIDYLSIANNLAVGFANFELFSVLILSNVPSTNVKLFFYA